MNSAHLRTKSLDLVPVTRDEALAMVEALSPSDRAQVSAAWLSQVHASSSIDPWVHGFSVVLGGTATPVGQCGFTGPPAAGEVEIAYGIHPEHQGKGFATEAAEALVAFAFADSRVELVLAHTLSENNASTRVLTKCGFTRVGEVIHPDDGLVWRWEKRRA